jgi:hypothetical protein
MDHHKFEEPNTGKKILWTALITLATAASAALAARLTSSIWTRMTGELPPAAPGWAKLLLGLPVKKVVEAGVGPSAN